MIITIFFSFKSHRIYGTIVMITIFFLSITSYGRWSLGYSLIICHIDWSWSSLSFFKSTSYIIRYVIIVFFKITSYDRDHHLLLQTHFVRSWSSLSYFFFFTITSYDDSLTIIEWLLLLQQYSNFKFNHGCDYYHYIITFIDRLITLLPIKPLGLTMDVVISPPSKSLGSPRKCT